MPSWPSTWIASALDALGVPANHDTIAIMRAWKDSTPISPYSNNPVGMPFATLGAPRFAGTNYAAFGTIDGFYAALASFGRSAAGRKLARDMLSESPYAAVWRDISALKWPGSATETDYPAAILDLTTESYRASVNATIPSARKTSGEVIIPSLARSRVIEQARSVAQAAQAITDTNQAVTYLLRRHARNA